MIQVFAGVIFYSCWRRRTLLFKLIKCVFFFCSVWWQEHQNKARILSRKLLAAVVAVFLSPLLLIALFFLPLPQTVQHPPVTATASCVCTLPPPAWGGVSPHVHPACVTTCLCLLAAGRCAYASLAGCRWALLWSWMSSHKSFFPALIKKKNRKES